MATLASASDIDLVEPASNQTVDHRQLDASHLGVIKLLITAESTQAIDVIKSALQDINCTIQAHRVATFDDLQTMLSQNDWDLVIACDQATAFTTLDVRDALDAAGIDIGALFLDTDYHSERALQALSMGFNDYLVEAKPEFVKYAIVREVNAIRSIRKAKVADAHIAEATATNHLLLDSTSDAIAYIADGVIVHANRSFLDALTYDSADDIEWQPFIDFIAESDHNKLRTILKEIAESSAPAQKESIGIRNANDEIMPLMVSFTNTTFEGDACIQVLLHTHTQTNSIGSTSNQKTSTDHASIEPALPPSAVKDETLSTTRTTALRAENKANDSIAEVIATLEGKGAIGFSTLVNGAQIQLKMGFDKYSIWLDHLTNLFSNELQEKVIFLQRNGESWSFIANESFTINEASQTLSDKLNGAVASEIGNDKSFFSTGISAYGVAELSPDKALSKAFTACASQQLKGKGIEIISPKIDNAEASEALISALELNRITLKYQPIIGLQNQEKHFYSVIPHILNDSGREQPASDLIDELGTECANSKLDRWMIQAVMDQFKNLPADEICASAAIPVTSSALLNEEFSKWLINYIDNEQISNEHFCFYITTSQLFDYEEKVQSFFNALALKNIGSAIFNCETIEEEQLSTAKPKIVHFSSQLTKNLLNPEIENAREILQTLLSRTKAADCQAVCGGVESAAELAQLWQTGVPFIQGSYLQGPLAEMTYEFAAIG